MYTEIVNKAYAYRGLTSAQKAVLVYLSTLANAEGGDIFPGDEKIAFFTNLSLRTVKSRRQDLEEKDLILPDIPHQNGRSKPKNSYRLNFELLGVDVEKIKPFKGSKVIPIIADVQSATNGHSPVAVPPARPMTTEEKKAAALRQADDWMRAELAAKREKREALNHD